LFSFIISSHTFGPDKFVADKSTKTFKTLQYRTICVLSDVWCLQFYTVHNYVSNFSNDGLKPDRQ